MCFGQANYCMSAYDHSFLASVAKAVESLTACGCSASLLVLGKCLAGLGLCCYCLGLHCNRFLPPGS